jgi:hypothetical protein
MRKKCGKNAGKLKNCCCSLALFIGKICREVAYFTFSLCMYLCALGSISHFCWAKQMQTFKWARDVHIFYNFTVRACSILHVFQFYILQFYNFQALLNHRANGCSCFPLYFDKIFYHAYKHTRHTPCLSLLYCHLQYFFTLFIILPFGTTSIDRPTIDRPTIDRPTIDQIP